MDRRHFVSAAAMGVATAGAGLLLPTAAFAAPTAKLPGEKSRTSSVRTARGTLYDNIEVVINGDPARIFIPQGLSKTASVGAVWFFHGAGSNHNAMNGGFKYPAELVVDQKNTIAICISAGGTQYSNAFAQKSLTNAWAYLSSLYKVRMNFFRATSGGGSLATFAYPKKMLPYVRGLYMVNAMYDNEELAARDTLDQTGIRAAFGSVDALKAGNPARIPASAWTGSRVKVVVSDAANYDATVPPEKHGLLLINRIKSVAADTRVQYHQLKHDTPSWAHKDMITTFAAWSGLT